MFFLFVLAVRHHWIDLGLERGVAQESQQQQVAQAGTLTQVHDSTVPQLQELTRQISSLALTVAALQGNMNALGQQRQRDTQTVAGMTPEQVQTAINQALGKPQGSTDFNLDDRRRALDCFQQLPSCNQQVQTGQAIIQGLREAEDKQQQRYQMLAIYQGQWQQAYVTLWNDKSLPRRRPYCLWLCKTKPVMKSPPPGELLTAKPN